MPPSRHSADRSGHGHDLLGVLPQRSAALRRERSLHTVSWTVITQVGLHQGTLRLTKIHETVIFLPSNVEQCVIFESMNHHVMSEQRCDESGCVHCIGETHKWALTDTPGSGDQRDHQTHFLSHTHTHRHTQPDRNSREGVCGKSGKIGVGIKRYKLLGIK